MAKCMSKGGKVSAEKAKGKDAAKEKWTPPWAKAKGKPAAAKAPMKKNPFAKKV